MNTAGWIPDSFVADQIMASTIRSACCKCIFSRLVMHSKLIFHVINLIKRDVISIKKQQKILNYNQRAIRASRKVEKNM